LGGVKAVKANMHLPWPNHFKKKKVFIATCNPKDREMKDRVRQHQRERGSDWETIEAPDHLPEAIIENISSDTVLLVDCLTLWISNLFMEKHDLNKISNSIEKLLRAIENNPGPLLFVSNEVGGGVVPGNKLARDYRDTVGTANQAVADWAKQVIWVVAGIPVSIKGT
jgi:adenosylcobinamide kinase/adenosylcobinamide-phosphate guanylyltransferase